MWSKDLEKDIKQEEDDNMMDNWKLILEKTNLPGAELRNAISEFFNAWMYRNFGGINFHTTQILSNHGCFRKFLNRTKRVDSAICLYCTDLVYTAAHTLFDCQKWQDEKVELMQVLNCAIKEVVAAICEDKIKWRSFNHFAKTVMLSKEALERNMERRRVEGGAYSCFSFSIT